MLVRLEVWVNNVLVRLEEGGIQCAGEIGGRGLLMCW